MGVNDDLRELGELAGMVNDEGTPLPEFKAALAEPTPVLVGQDPAPAAPAPDQPAALDLDAMLGLTAPPPAAPAPPPAEPPAGSAEARIKELNDRLRRSEEEREMLLRRHLADQPGDLPQPDPAAPVLDETTRDFLSPYIQAEVDKRVAERVAPLEEELAPIRQQSKDAALAGALTKIVGQPITAEHVKVLHREYDAITDDDTRAVFGNGLAGAVALAHSLISRGVLDLAGSKPRPSVNPLANRHATPTGGPAGSVDDARDEEAKIRAILGADNDAWLAALRARGID
ncbi:MAG: hypothetical protein FJX72_07405 [Armatimonadetes bacterium]|nr:hypothetical protein [Armatimonadota bacterium]